VTWVCLAGAGDSERKINKAAEETDVDCVCLDLEDAVAHSRKGAARDTIVTALSSECTLLARSLSLHGSEPRELQAPLPK
jgi:hypothetical protein